MRILRSLLAIVLLTAQFPAVSWGAKSEFGVLVLAQSGTPQWNKTVAETVKSAQISYPTRIFFGMGNSREEADKMQVAVNWLQSKGVHTIIVIPLLVSTYSEVNRQWRYLLGVDVNPGFNVPLFPLTKRVDIQFTDPFNDDPIIGLILLDRMREVSQTPENESVILIASGPNDNSDNEKWTRTLQSLCAGIKARGSFKNVEPRVFRESATDEVRSQSVNRLRARVEAISQEGGKAIVIPYIIAPGGIENKVGIALKGLDYTLNAKVLMLDHRIAQWIRSKVP